MQCKSKRNTQHRQTTRRVRKKSMVHSGAKEEVRISIDAGWKRAFNKYSPSKAAKVSPIKAAEANLKPNVRGLKDVYVDIFTWVVNMSEQYFYDNSFLLLSYNKKDSMKMKTMLHRSCIGVDMSFFNALEDVTLLGSGGFGSVYSCLDKKTKLQFAVKVLSAKFKKYTDHAENLLDYMDERNAVIRSMDSPFVVKFYYSLQMKVNGSLFLFFEFCIGDLISFIDGVMVEDEEEVSEQLYNNKENIIGELYKKKPELLEACFIYIFEIFCGLDFLMKCNIIHQDIKPDNIMVSTNLHLKIGDFGLTYKTMTIHRETNKVLVKASDIDVSESSNYKIDKPGTQYYQDFELQLMIIEEDEDGMLDKILNNKRKFDSHGISFDDEVLEPSFMVDTWAGGVTALMLLFRGFEMLNPESTSKKILKDVPREPELFIIHLVARQSIFIQYVKNGLKKSGGKDHFELMSFLASILKPRLRRCKNYARTKEVYRYKDLIKMKYIDMDLVEKIQTFKDRNITQRNIHLRDVPEKVRTFYKSKKKPDHKTFKDLLDSFARELKHQRIRHVPKVVDVDPGITINFFN